MNHESNDTQKVKLTGEEVAKHNNKDSCWVIIHGRAYDITEFLPEHPGGPKIILKYAGKDATEEYDPIHPPDTLDKYLDKSKHLGEVDMNTVKQETKEEDPYEQERQEAIKRMPILEQCYNLMDFEAVARKVMKKSAWAYYSSGADDEIVRPLVPRLEPLLTYHRHCARTTAHSTRSGSAHASSSTSRKSTPPLPCLAPK
jgi:L-lactate dehydrogenase (cytochrome)